MGLWNNSTFFNFLPTFFNFLPTTPDTIFPFMSDFAPLFCAIPLIERLSYHLIPAVFLILKRQKEEGLYKVE